MYYDSNRNGKMMQNYKQSSKISKKTFLIRLDFLSHFLQGECTITYEDCEASQAAVNWFNGKEFDSSHTIKVSIAQRKAPEGGFQKGGRGRGRGRGGDSLFFLFRETSLIFKP